jgi:4-hydroxybutyrate dehydrogenase
MPARDSLIWRTLLRKKMKPTKSVKQLSTFSFPTKIFSARARWLSLPSMLGELKIRRPLIVTDAGILPTGAFARLQKFPAANGRCFRRASQSDGGRRGRGRPGFSAKARCDAVLAFGGGSPLDAGKAVRLRSQTAQVEPGEL